MTLLNGAPNRNTSILHTDSERLLQSASKKDALSFSMYLKDLAITAAMLSMFVLLFEVHHLEQIAFVRLLTAIAIEMVIFGIPIFICHSVSVRLLRSNTIFFLLSWVLALIPVGLAMYANASQETAYSVEGNIVFSHGQITLYGFAYRAFTPFLLQALYATYKIECHSNKEGDRP